MRAVRSVPRFDHGAALRVPPAHDARSWSKLWIWLGEAGLQLEEAGAAQVRTPDGYVIARPGDWIVLSVSGDYHVAHGPARWDG